ncbi:MAG: hypothetical protein OEW15_00455 [Nitrospirota bacterium]|nr:hypothetical protein [Nitrospirota bacterium]
MDSSKLNLSNIRFDAVIVGAIVDNITTMSLMLLLMSAMSATGIPQDEVISRMKTLSGLLLSLMLGLGCTAFGGYVAARMAKKSEILHGAWVGGFGIVLALVFREEGLPLWYHVAGFICMLPAGMAGGHLARHGQVKS